MEATAERTDVTVLRGKVVTPEAVLDDGVVVIADDRLAAVGAAAEVVLPDGARLPPPDRDTVLLPGLVDLHNHGGGGQNFPDAQDDDAVRTAVGAHLSQGTTTMLASLVTAAPGVLLERAARLGELAATGLLAGIHCEGPFLSHERRGAQSPDHLLHGDPGFVRELAAAAGGHLRTMTVAPEVRGVLGTGPAGTGGAAQALVEAGVVPSLGHTSGTAEQAEALIAQVAPALAERGLRMTVTHLFNGMPSLHHRDPGPVAACLAAAARGDLVVELVGDGVHLAPAIVRTVMATLPGATALVTDAMAAAGMPDGTYRLGPMDVTVHGGVARLKVPHGTDPAGGAIAGGTARLIDVVRATVAAGVDLVDAVAAASSVPASGLGLTEVGALKPGRRADVLVTNAGLHPRQVWRAGTRIA